MEVQHKTLRTGGKTLSSRLCLVIPLGNGIKAQYAVRDQAEALALYELYLSQHPDLNLHRR